ncbi:MAG: threonine ammonia-lyase [Solirubrobacteraceae bacterium]
MSDATGVAWREMAPRRIARVGPAAPADSAHPGLPQIEAAAARIDAHVVRTPVEALRIEGLHALAKLEALQHTGSFKLRGAASRMLTLDARQRAAGVVAASSGNHGRAVAHVAAQLGVPAVICVPSWVDAVKLEAMRESGAEIHMEADSYDGAALAADRLAAERGLAVVHPFDDPEVIAGQGTIGLELTEQEPALDVVLIPLSGGGLCAGIAAAVRARSPGTTLIGVSARNAAVLHNCLLAGRRMDVAERPTLASALSGGLGERNDHSLAMVASLLDEAWLVDEDEIARAMLWGAERLGTTVEGGGAVALAPLLAPWSASSFRRFSAHGDPPRVAAIVSGANVDEVMLERARALAA